MTEPKEPPAERRGQTAEVIDHFLSERRQLLALLIQTSALKPTDTDSELLREFCQVLVDYIASGHFGLYGRVVDKKERRKSVAELALMFYPRIEEVTQAALAFNEKYAQDKGKTDLARIHEDLSDLGEQLANRIELEDKLISQLVESRNTI